jgi:hypothetical protein
LLFDLARRTHSCVGHTTGSTNSISRNAVIPFSSLSLKIFRYYKANRGLSVLRDLELRASLATELNDPFELSPNIDPAQFDRRRIEIVLRQDSYIDSAYSKEGRQQGFTNKKDFKRWYLKDISRRSAALLPKTHRNVESVKRDFAASFNKYWRLVCASLIHDSILMWSHYADNHTGLVLAFDTTQVPFSQIPTDCRLTVKYSNKRADYAFSHKERQFRRNMFAVAASKASDWSYEKEIRIIFADSSLRDGRFLQLTPESIAAVYCGCRVSSADETAVRHALATPHFKHVELWLAGLDEFEYALKFVKCDS